MPCFVAPSFSNAAQILLHLRSTNSRAAVSGRQHERIWRRQLAEMHDAHHHDDHGMLDVDRGDSNRTCVQCTPLQHAHMQVVQVRC